MSFADDIAEMHAANAETFGGEEIIYDLGGGVTRTITAMVQRNPPASVPEAPSVSRLQFRVSVVASATAGILPSEFDAGAHKLWIARKYGGTREAWSGWTVIQQTAAGMILEK